MGEEKITGVLLDDKQDYERFKFEILKKTGIDLNLYKEAQMKRRLTAFYEKQGFSNFSAFFQHGLTKQSELLDDFLERITINVSEFYRNQGRWQALSEKILPRLLLETKSLNAWSAACSQGEEPYTLAMIMESHFPDCRYKILATDIDQSVIKRAEAGFYSERSLKNVPPLAKNEFFQKESSGYRVVPNIKRNVSFTTQNLLSEPFSNGLNLVICRNVLIYFTEEAKEILYKKFNRALTIGGVLFVGSTEQIFNPEQYGFEAEDTFFYKKQKNV